jgi:DNA (cytosine-5)-methyltransferase 1
MRELALFAGAGGGILGGHLLGWRTVCAVEFEQYAVDVLVARQNDGLLPPFPIWDDVRTFDGRPWRGRVDVVSGGFPCQDISHAGKGAGIDGERSGLWGDMARIIGEVRPRFVFVENAPALTSLGLGRVLGDLAELWLDAEWDVFGAEDLGGPHKRDRIWIVGCDPNVADPAELFGNGSEGNPGQRVGSRAVSQSRDDHRPSGVARPYIVREWLREPDVGRVADGVAAGVDRLHAIGNGQVPRVAAAAFELLRRRGGW